MVKDIKIEKNALINLLNRIVTMTLSLFTLIIVTKRIGSENYGMITFCESIVAYFWLIASLGNGDFAIRECSPIRDDKKKVNDLINRLFSFNVITSLIAFGLFIVFILLIKLSKIEKIILLIFGIRMLFAAFDLSWAYKIFEDYQFIAINRIVFEVVLFVVSLIFIKSKEDFMIFVVASTIVEIISYFIEFIGLKKYVKLCWTSNIRHKEFIKPILIIFASMTMTALYNNIDITMLGFIRSNSEVGLYKVSSKIYLAVLELINSICIVSLPRIAYYLQNDEKESYNILSNKIFQTILFLTIPAIFGILIVGNNAIPLIFGEEYIGSVIVLKIMCFSLFFAAMNNFLLNIILISYKKENEIFKITALGVVINIVLNTIIIPNYGMKGAAATTLLSEIFVFICSYVLCKSKLQIKNFFKNLIIVLIIGCIFIIICKIISLIELSSVIELILQIVLSISSYLIIINLCSKKNII